MARPTDRLPAAWVLLLAVTAACHDGESRPTAEARADEAEARADEAEARADANHQELQQARIETTCMRAVSLQEASEMYIVTHRGKCPASVDALVLSEAIPQAVPDPWKTPFDIRCTEHGVEIRSGGPDAQLYSADDIVLGPPDSACKLPTTE